jgi:hypothetical protein
MRNTKLSALMCSGILFTSLACSGRYEVGSNDANAGMGGSFAGKAAATGGDEADPMPGPDIGGMTAIAGTMAVGGSAPIMPEPPTMVDGAACGVPVGQPGPIAEPITNYMMWWFRLEKLIWNGQVHEPPSPLPFSIDYEQAGQIADDAMDQAVAETNGIPGVEGFLRRWLQLTNPDADFDVDWNAVLGAGAPAPARLLKLDYDPERVGVFTEPSFLEDQPTISRRGTTMVEAVFGQPVPREPPGLPPFEPPAGLTRREGLEQSVSSPTCAACHRLIDPLGFSLENYDGLGQYTLTDAGKPVDTSGTYQAPSADGMIVFKSIVDLSKQLATRCDVHLAFADQFLIHALEQSDGVNPSLDEHAADRQRMRQAFMRNGRTYRSLIKAYAQSQAIRN